MITAFQLSGMSFLFHSYHFNDKSTESISSYVIIYQTNRRFTVTFINNQTMKQLFFRRIRDTLFDFFQSLQTIVNQIYNNRNHEYTA